MRQSNYAIFIHEGLAAVKKDGKWGYIDKEGNEVIPFVLFFTGNFNDGLVDDVLWNDEHGFIERGFIDKEGNFIGRNGVKKLK
jgi:hypothetical protein